MVAETCRVSKEASSSSIQSSRGAGRSAQFSAIKHASVVMLFFHGQQHKQERVSLMSMCAAIHIYIYLLYMYIYLHTIIILIHIYVYACKRAVFQFMLK